MEFAETLFACARLLDEIAQNEVNREAGRRLARPALMRLLPHLDRQGIRPTELARRVDVSKQAVSQSLNELAALGYVAFVPDERDRRAVKAQLTDSGEAAFAYGRSVLQFYECELENRMGKQPMAELRSGLIQALEVLTVWHQQGAPNRPRR